MKQYEEMQKAQQDTNKANKWMNLPNGPRYMKDDTFSIYIAHSKIELTRCGQQNCGGTNYWKSPSALNKALLEIISEDKSILSRAMDLVKDREQKAVANCRIFAAELLEKAIEAEGES